MKPRRNHACGYAYNISLGNSGSKGHRGDPWRETRTIHCLDVRPPASRQTGTQKVAREGRGGRQAGTGKGMQVDKQECSQEGKAGTRVGEQAGEASGESDK